MLLIKTFDLILCSLNPMTANLNFPNNLLYLKWHWSTNIVIFWINKVWYVMVTVIIRDFIELQLLWKLVLLLLGVIMIFIGKFIIKLLLFFGDSLTRENGTCLLKQDLQRELALLRLIELKTFPRVEYHFWESKYRRFDIKTFFMFSWILYFHRIFQC